MGLIMKNGVPYASGSEIPEGGTKGQVLAKASNISGDFEWVNGGGGGGTVDTTMSDTSENAVQNKVIKAYVDNVNGLPGGGTNGQALIKKSDADGDADWGDVSLPIDAYTKAETNALLSAKQNTLTTGKGAKIDNNVISFDYVTAGKKAVAYSGPYTKTVSVNLQYKDADYTFTEYIDFGNMGFTSPSDYSLEVIGSIVHNSASSIIATCLTEAETSRTVWSGTRSSFTVAKENNRIRLYGWFTGPGSGYFQHDFTCSILCKVYCAGEKPTDTTNIIMQTAGTGGICPQTLGVKGSVAEIPANSTTPITVDISALNIDTDYTRETFVQFDYYSYYGGLRQTVVCEGTGGIFNLPISNSAAGDVVLLEARVNGVEGGKLTDIVFTPLGASQGCYIYRVVWGKYTGGGGVPAGGTTGQVLAKKSDADGDTEWVTGGGGGETPTLDAVLKKGNSTERSATFTDSNNGVQAEIYANGTYMTGNGTEGMRQFSVSQNGIRAVDNLVGTITPKFVVPFEPSGEDQVAMSDEVKASFRNALDMPTLVTQTQQTPGQPITATFADGDNEIRFDVAGGTIQMDFTDAGATNTKFLATQGYVDEAVGDLTTLTTTDKTSAVGAINELDNAVKGLGEPFRVKNWASNTINVEIPYCTEDLANSAIAKMTYSIDAVEGADYQIVGMIAYEVFDAASGGNRINCFPVCQFTGNGQKELSVRWTCMGTTRKTAKRINAWVLLKHR